LAQIKGEVPGVAMGDERGGRGRRGGDIEEKRNKGSLAKGKVIRAPGEMVKP